jgi:hypothetical protein
LADYNGFRNQQDRDFTLTEIMHLVDMSPGVTSDGWNAETARLFAIDTAMTVIRRNMTLLADVDRHRLFTQLHEARRLVDAERDEELGAAQAVLEIHLSETARVMERRMWLLAIDALLPCPYRAALITTRNALAPESGELFDDPGILLKDRLIARLGEGTLLTDVSGTTFLTA